MNGVGLELLSKEAAETPISPERRTFVFVLFVFCLFLVCLCLWLLCVLAFAGTQM